VPPEEAARRGFGRSVLDAIGSVVARITERVARLISGR
jgi:hypothetical protein